jgi:hypothetical protein
VLAEKLRLVEAPPSPAHRMERDRQKRFTQMQGQTGASRLIALAPDRFSQHLREDRGEVASSVKLVREDRLAKRIGVQAAGARGAEPAASLPTVLAQSPGSAFQLRVLPERPATVQAAGTVDELHIRLTRLTERVGGETSADLTARWEEQVEQLSADPPHGHDGGRFATNAGIPSGAH